LSGLRVEKLAEVGLAGSSDSSGGEALNGRCP
jgi:hypothetical protein